MHMVCLSLLEFFAELQLDDHVLRYNRMTIIGMAMAPQTRNNPTIKQFTLAECKIVKSAAFPWRSAVPALQKLLSVLLQ